MNFTPHRLFLAFLATFSIAGTVRALRPQGSDAAFTDIITVDGLLLSLSEDGRIFRSTDGGDSYGEIHAVAFSGLFALSANGNKVIATGTDGILHRAADIAAAPTAWSPIAHGHAIPGDLRGIASRGTGVWIAVGDAILSSENDGENWTMRSSLGNLHAITHVGGSVWVTVGGVGISGGKIYRTEDDGVTWTLATFPTIPALLAVAADGFGNVLAVGENGSVLYSSNQGAAFTGIGAVDASETLNAVVSTGENAWVLGGQQRTLISLNASVAVPLLVPLETPVNIEGLALFHGSVVMAGIDLVPAPVISAPLEISVEPIQVLLTSDPTVEEIFYTITGADPDASSPVYAAPFWVAENLVVKAVAVKDGVYSAIAFRTFEAGPPALYFLSLSMSPPNLLVSLAGSKDGQPYQLQSTSDLRDPQVWVNVGALQSGTGLPLTWTVTPIPDGVRAWRTVLP